MKRSKQWAGNEPDTGQKPLQMKKVKILSASPGNAMDQIALNCLGSGLSIAQINVGSIWLPQGFIGFCLRESENGI